MNVSYILTNLNVNKNPTIYRYIRPNPSLGGTIEPLATLHLTDPSEDIFPATSSDMILETAHYITIPFRTAVLMTLVVPCRLGASFQRTLQQDFPHVKDLLSS